MSKFGEFHRRPHGLLGGAMRQYRKTNSSSNADRRVDLLARTAVLALWDAFDSAGIWQDAAGTTPAGAADPIGRLDDWSGNGEHLTAASDGLRPARTAGVTWGFSEQRLDFPAGLPAGITFIALVITTIDTTGVLWGQQGTAQFGAIYQSAGASVAEGNIGGSVSVDGSSVATRGDFYTALMGGVVHRVEHSGTTAAISGTAALNSYNAGGLKHIGVMVPVCILDDSATDYSDALTDARAFCTQLISDLGL